MKQYLCSVLRALRLCISVSSAIFWCYFTFKNHYVYTQIFLYLVLFVIIWENFIVFIIVTKKTYFPFSILQFGFFFSHTKNMILQHQIFIKKNEISCSNNFTTQICIELLKTVATSQFKFYDMILPSILWRAAVVYSIAAWHCPNAVQKLDPKPPTKNFKKWRITGFVQRGSIINTSVKLMAMPYIQTWIIFLLAPEAL